MDKSLKNHSLHPAPLFVGNICEQYLILFDFNINGRRGDKSVRIREQTLLKSTILLLLHFYCSITQISICPLVNPCFFFLFNFQFSYILNLISKNSATYEFMSIWALHLLFMLMLQNWNAVTTRPYYPRTYLSNLNFKW